MATLYTLGTVPFQAGKVNLDGLSRSRSYRHNFTDSIRGEGTRTYTGKGADEITLTGVVFPGQYGQSDAAELLAAQARVGQPLQLIDGSGYLLGRYVILDLAEDAPTFLADGTPRQLTYTINLRKDPVPLDV